MYRCAQALARNFDLFFFALTRLSCRSVGVVVSEIRDLPPEFVQDYICILQPTHRLVEPAISENQVERSRILGFSSSVLLVSLALVIFWRGTFVGLAAVLPAPAQLPAHHPPFGRCAR